MQVPRQAGDREAGAHQAPPARFRRTTATAPAATNSAPTSDRRHPAGQAGVRAGRRSVSGGSAASLVAGRSVGVAEGVAVGLLLGVVVRGVVPTRPSATGSVEPDEVAVGEDEVGVEVGAVGDGVGRVA